jgi:hypothetical protein
MTSRYCCGCKGWRSLDDFAFKNVLEQTRHSRCRICCREGSRRHYGQNKGAYLERNCRYNPLRRENGAEFVHQLLTEHPCAQCGEADPIVLEFDHRDPAEKLGNVSDMVRNVASLSRLRAEIAKCEVLCANCHQRRTLLGRQVHYKTREAGSRPPAWRVAANQRNAELVLARLAHAQCADCGFADPLVLQFDHRAVKRQDIGWFVSSGSRATLVAEELAKWDVRCANCHRRRTAQQLGWYRARVAAPELRVESGSFPPPTHSNHGASVCMRLDTAAIGCAQL